MNIEIDLNDFIDLIKNVYSTEEIARIIAKYVDYSELDLEENDLSEANIEILADAILKKYTTLYSICENFDNNPDLAACCIFKYFENKSAINGDYDELCDALDILVDSGYITSTGLITIDEDEHELDYFLDIVDYNYIAWYEDDLECESEHKDFILKLIKAFLKTCDNSHFCESRNSWTNAPAKFIEYWLFSGVDGAYEVADILFDNFDKLKETYSYCFNEIINITEDTTLNEFREAIKAANYSEFKAAYIDLIEETNFLEESGLFESYFG